MMANNLVPQDVLRAPTWYENALLNAIMPYSKQTPAANALINATTNAQSSLAYPALQYAKGNKVSYKDIWNALTGNNTADWVDVMKEVLPKAQRKMPENVYVNPKMAGAMGTALNMLLDPTNFVPVGIAGEIKNVRHVSPHLFDKFSGDFIGKGEGAAAFGVGKGGYWTEADGVVNSYVDSFRSRAVDSANPEQIASALFDAELEKSIFDDAITVGRNQSKYTRDRFIKDYVAGKIDNSEFSTYTWSKAEQKLGKVYEYEATIAKGRPHKMLQWDEPVSNDVFNKITSTAQKDGIDLGLNNPSAHFKIWIRKHYPSLESSFDAGDISDWHRKELIKQYEEETGKKAALKKDVLTASGSRLYRLLSGKLGSYEATSAFLKRAGIDGIEYPSGTLSGIKDSPHKNYVVFDDADITIEKRTPR